MKLYVLRPNHVGFFHCLIKSYRCYNLFRIDESQTNKVKQMILGDTYFNTGTMQNITEINQLCPARQFHTNVCITFA